MNISDGIIKVLDNLAMKFGIAIDWTAENVSPYLQELSEKFIRYEISTSWGLIGLMVTLCIIAWLIAEGYYKNQLSKEEDEKYRSFDYLDGHIQLVVVLCYVLAIGLSIATVIVTCTQIFDIIEAKTIPEKTIYDYISQAMKKGT